MTGYAVVHDVDGPRVRLGVAWFAVTVGSCIAGRLPLALLMAVAAALAADQLVCVNDPRCARPLGLRPSERAQRLLVDPIPLVAVLAAGSLPLAAAAGSDTLAAAVAAGIAVAVLVAGGRVLVPLTGALATGLAAASPVLLHRLDMTAALVLLVLVAAYDAGDFVVGTGARAPWEGPAAGIAAVAVVGFAATVLALPPLDEEGAAALALLVALLGPLGPLVASMLIGNGITSARHVRRLDSLILAGPVAAYVLAGLY